MHSFICCTQGAQSNSIDSGATMDGVSPKFCTTNGLWDSLEITLAAKKTLTVPTKTVRLTLYMENFKPYVNDFLVIEVPEGQDLLLGMPWLKTNNPDIDWIKERVRPRFQSEVGESPSPKPTKRRRAKNKVKTPRKPARPAVKIGGQRQPVSVPNLKTNYDNLFSCGYYSSWDDEIYLRKTISTYDKEAKRN
ncbi:LOW QUALITY PROTEIN: hypothetical protein PHPALM_29691 [Phytophthora palmivora]|uniref:Uncharacterized protein n=1 Tax=Phytophthora palmivora TaxID=4796 RepID=A0A2P4X703_9STRA|nr:LOW QUALITY PROTEIN: hypothetical protein PHPALM_29691 [Phytophthora palmivora]